MLPNQSILARTFFIKGLDYGTAFTLDVDGAEYLITARHLLSECDDSPQIRLFRNEQWETITAQVVGHGRGEVDVSVLALPERLTRQELRVKPTIAGLALGQDAYFLGFPYKLWTNVGGLLGGIPCAFVRKGTVSAYQLSDPQIIHLDAFNNPGFSGGPIFFFPAQNPREGCVAGVVSKFRLDEEQVVGPNGDKTGLSVALNSGFLIAYGIQHVLDIIQRSQLASDT